MATLSTEPPPELTVEQTTPSTETTGAQSAAPSAPTLSSSVPKLHGDAHVQTPFGINRYALLVITVIYVILVGSHFFNWTPWERILIDSGAYSHLCEPGLLEACVEQRAEITSLLQLVTLSMFSFTFIAGMCLDIIGPKICCIVGNSLLIIGWVLLAISSPTRDTYKAGFIFMGAGTDPAFFGTLSIANLFPGYSSTIISVLGGARSLSNVWPMLLSFVDSDTFKFPQMAILFVVAYVACLIFVIVLVPAKPYRPPKTSVLRMEPSIINNNKHLAISGAVSDEPEVSPATPRALPDEEEQHALHSEVTIHQVPAAQPRGCCRHSWLLIKIQLWTLYRHLTSLLYLPIVVVTIINVIRNNFYLSSATSQLGSAETLLVILNALAFIPGPILGLVVDKFGPLSVIAGVNTTNLFVYIALVLSETVAGSATFRDVLNYSSTVLAFPGIGFLLSQVYCYIAVVFPPDDMGKLAGFASFVAGICNLVVNPMYTFSTRIGKFWPMNSVNIATSAVNYALIVFLFWRGANRVPKAQHQSSNISTAGIA